MVLPDLSQLPPWAIVLFAVSLAIIIGLAWVGEKMGRRAAPAASNSAQVAAVIVDPTALMAAAGEVSGLTVAIHEVIPILHEVATQQKRIADELDNVREEMRIHREISRR